MGTGTGTGLGPGVDVRMGTGLGTGVDVLLSATLLLGVEKEKQLVFMGDAPVEEEEVQDRGSSCLLSISSVLICPKPAD